MMKKLNALPRRYRWPIKWAVVGLTAFLVCYPYPHLFVRNLERWRNPNALINPEAAALQPMATELRGMLKGTQSPPEMLRTVERYVHERIPYAFDWETWGVADYLPTVEETLRMGREDCDGQAVVAASLLRGLGCKAQLVSDYMHVWVATDRGDFMGPRPSRSAVGTDQGLKVLWGWRSVVNSAAALGYGVAVFPRLREAILLLAVWLTLIGPRTPWRAAVLGALLMVAGWVMLRAGGRSGWEPIRWLQWGGLAAALGGIVALVGRQAFTGP